MSRSLGAGGIDDDNGGEGVVRIRSTKPEFWRSKTISELDYFTRLVLKALEAYVDDNGVGKDPIESVVIFCADAFPHDLARNPSSICTQVTHSLQALCDRNLAVRYSIDGEPLIYVRRWKQWQYIDRPNKGRHPRPDGTLEYKDTVDETIVAGQGVTDPVEPPEVRETCTHIAPNVPPSCPQNQSGEQGNRGTGEQNPPTPQREPSPSRAPARRTGSDAVRDRIANLPARSVDAYRIAEAFSASSAVPIEDGLLSGIGVQIDKCLKRGIPPPAIAAGLKAWTDSDSWSPTQIPHFVHKANNGNRNRTTGKPTEKAVGYDAALTELLQEVQTL